MSSAPRANAAMLRVSVCLNAERARAQSAVRLATSHVAAVMGCALRSSLSESVDYNCANALKWDPVVSTAVHALQRVVRVEDRNFISDLVGAAADHLVWQLTNAQGTLESELARVTTEPLADFNDSHVSGTSQMGSQEQGGAGKEARVGGGHSESSLESVSSGLGQGVRTVESVKELRAQTDDALQSLESLISSYSGSRPGVSVERERVIEHFTADLEFISGKAEELRFVDLALSEVKSEIASLKKALGVRCFWPGSYSQSWEHREMLVTLDPSTEANVSRTARLSQRLVGP